jgi:hypothetical protein
VFFPGLLSGIFLFHNRGDLQENFWLRQYVVIVPAGLYVEKLIGYPISFCRKNNDVTFLGKQDMYGFDARETGSWHAGRGVE